MGREARIRVPGVREPFAGAAGLEPAIIGFGGQCRSRWTTPHRCLVVVPVPMRGPGPGCGRGAAGPGRASGDSPVRGPVRFT